MTAHHNVHQPIEGEPRFYNRPAKNVSFFTPAQDPPAGTAILEEGQKTVPKLFRPLKLRGLTFQNRIMLSPLCQYSADNGHLTNWHKTHLGGIIQRGPGISCVEATSVTANGRITPEDSGLWQDSQIAPLKEIVDFAHSQNQKIMIQLGHAGRKASTVAPWLSSGYVAGKELNGWPDDVYGASGIQWGDNFPQPREMTLQDIADLKTAFIAAVKRALQAGFDMIEIHGAHGYLISEFLSPVSNKRTDQYGGSFENRVRLSLELVEETRKVIPADMPLAFRVNGTEWLEEQSEFTESWTENDVVKLAPLLVERGVDFLDISSGGNHPKQHPHTKPAYQAPFAIKVKQAVGDKAVVGSVGSIENATLANNLLEKDNLDFVTVGRGFQKNPGLVFAWGEELGVHVNMPNQIRWGFGGRGKSAGLPATDVPELIDEFKGQTQ